MKSINQLTANLTTLTNSEQRQQLSTETHSQANQERSINLVIDLFEDWLRMYGSKLKERQTLDLRTAELWTLAIRNSGITLAEFKTAAELSLNLKWPPTAAQDFIELVKGDVSSNYPDMRKAYMSAAQGNYKHEVTLETAKRVGTWELKTQPESISYKSWQKHYVDVCKEHSEGADFKVPESRQVAYSHTPLQETSPMAATVDEFLNQFKRKHGEQA